jgi:hypothetical protein
MAKFCDRSPCSPLMAALGSYIFGSQEGFILLVPSGAPPHEEVEIDIDYCPFCGTRLEEVPQIQVDKFTRPRRGRAPRSQSTV